MRTRPRVAVIFFTIALLITIVCVACSRNRPEDTTQQSDATATEEATPAPAAAPIGTHPSPWK